MKPVIKTVSQQVYERLKSEILSGTLLPGDWVRELDVAAELEVSRTPVREAVRRLAQEGLLELVANRGVKVRHLSSTDVMDVYELREVLEGIAARKAAQLASRDGVEQLEKYLEVIERTPPEQTAAHIVADDDFHMAVVKLAGSSALYDVISMLSDRVTRAKILTRNTNASELTRDQHRQVVAAIAAGAATEAERAMRNHIRTYRQVLEEMLSQSLDSELETR